MGIIHFERVCKGSINQAYTMAIRARVNSKVLVADGFVG